MDQLLNHTRDMDSIHNDIQTLRKKIQILDQRTDDRLCALERYTGTTSKKLEAQGRKDEELDELVHGIVKKLDHLEQSKLEKGDF